MTEDTLDANGLLIGTPHAILTHSGIFIEPLNPAPEAIRIEDIAFSLSNQARWTGHVRRYSVAEHCLGVAHLTRQPIKRLEALLHDASEAYLNDFARPVKKHPEFGALYLGFEEKLEEAIGRRFEISPHALHDPEIKQADDWMLWAEAKMMLPRLGAMLPTPPDEAYDYIRRLEPEQAEAEFLRYFYVWGGEA